MINIGNFYVKDGQTVNKNKPVTKHGSHDQKTHAGGKGGGSTASGGGSSQSSTGGGNSAKVKSSLDQAKKKGLDKETLNDINQAYKDKDVDTLSDLEAGLFESAVGRHGGTAGQKNAEYHAHTAVIHALRELDKDSEESNWKTLDETGDL